eukprot:TRINITY_DN25546_c0_g1_i1.p1 TRINITY_DN25546_c0_g1~~TRINITY_DN25546_c0_g1_i1.p1  ORF type:complete len:111 (+),score=4.87 TRINITY_DN25546_c0_g1_i1:290-622(+)
MFRGVQPSTVPSGIVFLRLDRTHIASKYPSAFAKNAAHAMIEAQCHNSINKCSYLELHRFRLSRVTSSGPVGNMDFWLVIVYGFGFLRYRMSVSSLTCQLHYLLPFALDT